FQRLVLRYEDAQVAGETRRRGQAAADAQRVAVAAALAGADEHDAVDFGCVALGGAAGNGDLVLARQVEVVALALEELDDLVQLLATVEQLVGVQAGDRAAGDVA